MAEVHKKFTWFAEHCVFVFSDEKSKFKQENKCDIKVTALKTLMH